MAQNESGSLRQPDEEQSRVVTSIRSLPSFELRSATAARKAIDDVLQGDRTARHSIQSLTPEEKKHIGTQVERRLKREFFEDRKGDRLDTVIDGVEVDVKNTIGDNWMIPPEAVGQLCLLSRIDECSANFSVGVFRANIELLNRPNQDLKRSISKEGKKTICWIIKDASLAVSVFTTDQQVKEKVFAELSGQARIAELFRQVQDTPIQRSDIEVAGVHTSRQVDVRARVRDAKSKLATEGILVLRGWNPAERREAADRGHPISGDQCISLKFAKPEGNGSNLQNTS